MGSNKMPSALRKSSPVVVLAPAALSVTRPKAKRVRGHRVGSLVGRDERGWLADYPGNPHGPVPVRATLPLADADAKRAAGCSVLLVFEDERSDRPIVVGWLEPVGDEAAAPERATPAPGKPVEALVDGRRVVLEAEDEIVLRCGEASITLRRNGRVVVRGAYVETRSRGVNRIKGGTVQIN